ncbi:MAG: class I SAM-dependent methyltransferase [Parvibaculum sp.]|nr:class I SAM-dependent methyltransferase [Parvibaculum sp.]
MQNSGILNFEHEQNRIRGMLRRYLVPMLKSGDRVLSVGCGLGSDVVELRSLGFEAYGLDPSRLNLENMSPERRAYFRVGAVEDVSFNGDVFDFVYSLDVIEHVGCVGFGTVLSAEAEKTRVKFIAACLRVIAPGGVLLMTTSNKLCPIDPGHWHKYHWFGRLFPHRSKFGISLPWSKKNFLVSRRDVVRLVALAGLPGKFRVEFEKAALYPNISEKKGVIAKLITVILKFADTKFLIGTAFSPLLVLRITRTA